MTTFSIIVPAFNSATYINRAIDSVINQTFENFELIIVNDGSTDETEQICRIYAEKDNRIRVITQNNTGHTGARNTGLLSSRGEYVVFLDSDDYLDEDVLYKCAANIEQHSPDIIVFSISVNDRNSRILLKNRIVDGLYCTKNNPYIEKRLIIDENGQFVFPKSLSGKVFKRNIVLDNQLNIPKTILIGEDGACFVKTVLDSKTISVISDCCYNSIVRSESISRSSDRNAVEKFICLMEYYRDFIPGDNAELKKQADRFIVAQSYTAMQYVIRSDSDYCWIKNQYKILLTKDFVKSSISCAKFAFTRSGIRMIIKKFILKYGLISIMIFQNRKYR